ncbi:unnamed protein product [Didymodactylos carnosus]|uniref:Uncharacterized protein n=1 Tax=Didymodactylos carnosus TaxID=1234261 RepID=A0A815B6Y5_9BILA|nr:unnamed protein product [Didymodactylos carnosus]CAF1297844.1 unnamed protein product [Didymodactylos carnosus]CAF4047063.1 unnamed protein product [Didymodactylos carnosus]CAF4103316.1 unnamed protein product [Didymodactylos carnosus]
MAARGLDPPLQSIEHTVNPMMAGAFYLRQQGRPPQVLDPRVPNSGQQFSGQIPFLQQQQVLQPQSQQQYIPQNKLMTPIYN